MYSGNILEAIPRLPTDLQREIFKLIDIDTKLDLLLDNDDLVRWFTEQELSVVYKQGYVCKLFHYDNSRRRWLINADFVDMLPKTTFYSYPTSTIWNIFEDTILLTARHPVFDIIESLRMQDIGSNIVRIGLSIALMINTDTFDMKFNYYIRKLAFNILIAMNVYKRTCIKSRKIREDQRIQNELERELVRAERMAMRKIEIEEERNRRLIEEEMQRQRVIQEREYAIRIKEEAKQLIIAERIRNKRLKEERKVNLQREKEERRLLKTEQKAKIRQEKIDKQVVKTEEKLRRVQTRTAKKDLLRQKQNDKIENQTLNYISKLFK